MIRPLPLEVLGRLAPILSLSQGEGMLRERASILWRSFQGEPRDRERAWLGTHLRVTSHDVLDEVVGLALPKAIGVSSLDGYFRDTKEESAVEPGGDYRLAETFRFLVQRYLRWSGQTITIREGRMEELHELARLFPFSHVVHHLHAEALHDRTLPAGALLDMPTRLYALPSDNRSLQVIVQRGLAEGHMHLQGVTGTEEVWADHLLVDRSQLARGPDAASRRVRRLQDVNRTVVRLLAIAVLLEGLDRPHLRRQLSKSQSVLSVANLRLLLRCLDQILVEAEPRRRPYRGRLDELEKKITQLTKWLLWESELDRLLLLPGCETTLSPADLSVLHYLLCPETYPLLHRWQRFPGILLRKRSPMSDIERRGRVVDWLHLRIHERLVALWPRVGPDADPRGHSATDEAVGVGAEFLHRVFFRYLACQTHFHQLGTQHGERTGLRQFKRFYSSPQRRAATRDESHEIRCVLHRLFTQERIKIVEGRVSPSPQGRSTMRPWLREYARLRREEADSSGDDAVSGRGDRREPRVAPGSAIDPGARFGLVVHFIKEAEESESGSLTRPSGFARICRYQRDRSRVRNEALELYRFLREPDPIAPFILGIDAANLEYRSTPPEVFAPAFRFLRDEPIGKRRDDRFRRGFFYGCTGDEVLTSRKLALTFHVGEDFANILSALRAIDEAVEFLGMKPGDRLGHATALALDPKKWTQLIGRQTMVPKQEFLDTLVWTRQFLGPGHDLIGEMGIDDRIQALASEIYQLQNEISPLTLYRAWLLRQLDPTLLQLEPRQDPLPQGEDSPPCDCQRQPICTEEERWLRSPPSPLRLRRPMPRTEEEDRWMRIQQRILDDLHRTRRLRIKADDPDLKTGQSSMRSRYVHDLYLFDPEVRRRGGEPIVLDVDPNEAWTRVVLDVQAKLQKKVHDRHLVVETNLSSNICIGPIEAVRDHPIFRLASEQPGVPIVLTTVNTDDPGVFHTCLAHEYYLLGEDLLAQGRSETEVMEWLEKLRRNGHDYSFLVELRSVPQAQFDAMCAEIEKVHELESYYEKRWLPANFF